MYSEAAENEKEGSDTGERLTEQINVGCRHHLRRKVTRQHQRSYDGIDRDRENAGEDQRDAAAARETIPNSANVGHSEMMIGCVLAGNRIRSGSEIAG